jgi:hypothetical protein
MPVEGTERGTMKKKKKDQVERFTYQTVDGKVFIQRRLVLAQMEQLVERLKDVQWPDAKDLNLLSLYNAIGGRLPVALAVILTEKDKPIQGKDIDALGEELRFNFPLDEGIRALNDFFTLNPTASIAASLRDLRGTQAAMKAATDLAASAAATGSPTSL